MGSMMFDPDLAMGSEPQEEDGNVVKLEEEDIEMKVEDVKEAEFYLNPLYVVPIVVLTIFVAYRFLRK